MKEEVVEGFQLSPQQKHLWLLQERSAPFRSYCAVLLEGALDQEVLRVVLRTVLERHEILRTGFQSLAGVDIPLQVLSESSAADYCEVDLSDLDTLVQQHKIEEI